MLSFAILAAPAAALAQSPSPEPSASASAPVENPAVTKIARAQFEAWKSGKLDLDAYTSGVQAYFTADVKSHVKQFLTSLGDVQSFTYAGSRPAANGIFVETYRVTAAKGSALELIHLDDAGKIDSIFFTLLPK